MAAAGGPIERPIACALLCALGGIASAAESPQWGRWHSRNMVSDETGLPESFDRATGRNVRWVAPLGTETYASPVVAGGKVLIGTNNQRPRDPRHKGDRGVLLCLSEADGSLCWQLVVPKIPGDRYKDWPKSGLVSPPTVEGDRVYVTTNRAEVVCLDLDGLADGNDGPYRDEGRHMTPAGEPPAKVGRTDADIIWLFDMRTGVGMYPHDTAHTSILLHGDHLYLNTGNGVDNTHRRIRAPDAPSLIVLDKTTGRLVARDGERIGPRIFHCSWSAPSLGKVGERTLIFYGGGDGVVYAFEALPARSAPGPARRLKTVWRFDCDPAAPKTNVHRYVGDRRESPSTILGMPVFHEGRVYVTFGGDIWWGKRRAWIKCIDATKTGDVTKSGLLWSHELKRHSCSTPAVREGLVYVTDCGRQVYCLDAQTGRPLWTHDAKGEIWGSTLVADGKVYVGTRRRDLWVLEAGREKKVIGSMKLDSGIVGTPCAANGVLYVATMRSLIAAGKKTSAAPRRHAR
ncbi:MAG: outer membrane protein assembly factor BamB family protein [Planctomycetota bacterium]